MLAHNQEVLGSNPSTSQLLSRDQAILKFVCKTPEAFKSNLCLELNKHILETKLTELRLKGPSPPLPGLGASYDPNRPSLLSVVRQ